ncbi:MAG: EAL domain-containing protein, partial [Gemmatimonadota bacterium]
IGLPSQALASISWSAQETVLYSNASNVPTGSLFSATSLTFLNRLQPDVVKLDMELIRDVDSTPYKAEVASQILELADRIGAESVAEGVESEEEWAWVRDHGATYASGFLFGRPAPGERWADAGGA